MSPKTITFSLLILMALSNSIAQHGQIYSFNDLEILIKQKNWDEFIQHAYDIRPSERNQKWEDYLEKAAINKIGQFTKNQQFDRSTLQLIEKWYQLPNLNESSVFHTERLEYGLHYFAKNLPLIQESQITKDDFGIFKFWENTRKGQLGHEFIARLLEKVPNLNIYIPDLAISLSNDTDTRACKTNIIQKQILEYIVTLSPHEVDQFSKNTLSKACWRNFGPKLIEGFVQLRGDVANKTLKLIRTRSDVDEITKSKLQIVYLLNGPVIGDEFNLAWNKTSEISQLAKTRAKIINELTKLDPYPGDIFKTGDQTLKETIFRHLQQNIPEFFQSYLRNCRSFKENPKRFKNGRMTFECNEVENLIQK